MTSPGLERDLEALRRIYLDRLPAPIGCPPVAVSRAGDFDALVSRTATCALHDDAYVDAWIEEARHEVTLHTEIVPLSEVCGWCVDPETGNISHQTGRFFTIVGLRVTHRLDFEEMGWDQPIIEQAEVGILGIAARRIDGVLHFCLQAKEEPGNIGAVQLSPTVQATYSNYTQVHGGAAPPLLELFLDPPHERVIFSRLQTEDGSRFFYKMNRNMIVEADERMPLDLPPKFIWLTLRQIAGLMRRENLINACARSVLSGLVFPGCGNPPGLAQVLERMSGGDCGSLFDPGSVARVASWLPTAQPADDTEESMRATLQWIDDRRARNYVVNRRTDLNRLEEWHLDGKGFFSHREGRFFRIIGLSISSGTREVGRWCQPIIENPASGIIGILLRQGTAGMEILMQTRAEPGNRVAVQLAPTVQFTPGNYHGSRKLRKPFLFDEFSEPGFPVNYEVRQPEEGARFFRECHLHRVMLLPEGRELDIPETFHWLPVRQLRLLLHFGGQVNSCARSVLACLL